MFIDAREVWTVQNTNSTTFKKQQIKGSKNTSGIHKTAMVDANNKKEKLAKNKYEVTFYLL
jgi:hypothetical protein